MSVIDPLLTTDEVTEMLRISRASLHRRIKDGTIPAPIKLGHLARWSRADILSALAARKSPNARAAG